MAYEGYDENFEFYRLFGQNSERAYQSYENAYKNSSVNEGVAKPTENSTRRTNKISTRLIILACVVVLAVGTSFGAWFNNEINDYADEQAVVSWYQEQGLIDEMAELIWHSFDEKGNRVYGYKLAEMAERVNEAERPDLKLFSYYLGMNTNRMDNFDEIVSRLAPQADGSKFKNGNDFFVKKGFIDKNGNPSSKAYEDAMTTISLGVKKSEETGMQGLK